MSYSDPVFETIAPMVLVGCPQFQQKDSPCPGEAWKRWGAAKKALHLSPAIEWAVEVYPPDFDAEDIRFTYMAGMAWDDQPVPLHLFAKHVPLLQCAVFDVKDNDYAGTFHHAYRVWLPNSKYMPAAPMDFERYDRSGPHERIQVLIPVKEV